MADEEIAGILGVKVPTLRNYVYRAGMNGWLDDLLVEPKERMEYQIYNKVVDRLEEALESNERLQSGMKESTAVALKIGEGTLFNLPPEGPAQTQTTVVGIKVEVVGGEPQAMRAGTIAGNSEYVDGETKE